MKIYILDSEMTNNWDDSIEIYVPNESSDEIIKAFKETLLYKDIVEDVSGEKTECVVSVSKHKDGSKAQKLTFIVDFTPRVEFQSLKEF